MLEHSRIAVVVFWRHDNDAVSARNRRRKLRVLNLLAGVIDGEIQIAQVDQFSFDTCALLNFTKDEFRHAFAGAALPYGAQDYRDKKRSCVHSVVPGRLALRFEQLNAVPSVLTATELISPPPRASIVPGESNICIAEVPA